jgi:hypothetical protein
MLLCLHTSSILRLMPLITSFSFVIGIFPTIVSNEFFLKFQFSFALLMTAVLLVPFYAAPTSNFWTFYFTTILRIFLSFFYIIFRSY